MQDYPIEQYIRDAKIDSCSRQGTTAIQAQDFFFRKIVQTRAWRYAMPGQIQSRVDSGAGNGRLKTERALLAKALTDVQGMVAALITLMAAQQDVTSSAKVWAWVRCAS